MNNLNLYSETVSGYTAVSDLFIDEYVPSANGDFVKVYLYLLRLLTRKNSSLSISSLADTFNQTENDVMRALRYWDKSGRRQRQMCIRDRMRLLQMYRQMLFLWILPLKHHHILLSLQR